MEVVRQIIEPTYKRDTGVWVLHTQTVAIAPDFVVKEQSIVSIPPLQIGGNHKHPRREAFLGFGKELFLVWQDADQQLHEEAMNADDTIYLFLVESLVPHAVINKSSDSTAILYEYADDTQHDVVPVPVIKI